MKYIFTFFSLLVLTGCSTLPPMTGWIEENDGNRALEIQGLEVPTKTIMIEENEKSGRYLVNHVAFRGLVLTTKVWQVAITINIDDPANPVKNK